MRNRPNPNEPFGEKEKKFIEQAQADRLDSQDRKEDLHSYVNPASWPLDQYHPSPSLAAGSHLKKPIVLYLTEQEWKSIDRHTKVLGVSKQEWIKYAIRKLLEEEQLFFLKNSSKSSK
jgi:hypothetical protein